eukprot:CCRYP_005960-RA/>CCRYP_005960-RA protein AED:0.03 eAED:0.03 QI:75/1/1/1/1/1/3/59/463
MKRCDVCIIGSGPAGLCALSAVREPYTMDSMTYTQVSNANAMMTRRSIAGPPQHRVCVVDPNEKWLSEWTDNFKRLGIEFLRSPAIAHPDHFDLRSLLAYAVLSGREAELIESGCAEIRKLHGLGQTQVGLWKLPSTSLFEDFCLYLADQLPHDYVKSYAIDLDRNEEGDYVVKLANGTDVVTSSVILALGPTGRPVIPEQISQVPKAHLISWKCMIDELKPCHEIVLVVGGGLTAVQAAQYALRRGKRVYLSSRRQLVERHFDIDTCWFDKRSTNLHISEFYHLSEAERLSVLKEARGGGSVPPIYMKDLREWEKKGKLTLVTADPDYIGSTDNGKLMIALNEGKTALFDCIINACGIKPDCTANPLIKKITEKFLLKTAGGFPSISVDLEWTKNLFCVGALASLNVGPDSGNIMGARRGASIVANTLECKAWLRDKEGGALANPFQLLWDDETTDSESEID